MSPPSAGPHLILVTVSYWHDHLPLPVHDIDPYSSLRFAIGEICGAILDLVQTLRHCLTGRMRGAPRVWAGTHMFPEKRTLLIQKSHSSKYFSRCATSQVSHRADRGKEAGFQLQRLPFHSPCLEHSTK